MLSKLKKRIRSEFIGGKYFRAEFKDSEDAEGVEDADEGLTGPGAEMDEALEALEALPYCTVLADPDDYEDLDEARRRVPRVWPGLV